MVGLQTIRVPCASSSEGVTISCTSYGTPCWRGRCKAINKKGEREKRKRKERKGKERKWKQRSRSREIDYRKKREQETEIEMVGPAAKSTQVVLRVVQLPAAALVGPRYEAVSRALTDYRIFGTMLCSWNTVCYTAWKCWGERTAKGP